LPYGAGRAVQQNSLARLRPGDVQLSGRRAHQQEVRCLGKLSGADRANTLSAGTVIAVE
jgi:hypothetical protein